MRLRLYGIVVGLVLLAPLAAGEVPYRLESVNQSAYELSEEERGNSLSWDGESVLTYVCDEEKGLQVDTGATYTFHIISPETEERYATNVSCTRELYGYPTEISIPVLTDKYIFYYGRDSLYAISRETGERHRLSDRHRFRVKAGYLLDAGGGYWSIDDGLQNNSINDSIPVGAVFWYDDAEYNIFTGTHILIQGGSLEGYEDSIPCLVMNLVTGEKNALEKYCYAGWRDTVLLEGQVLYHLPSTKARKLKGFSKCSQEKEQVFGMTDFGIWGSDESRSCYYSFAINRTLKLQRSGSIPVEDTLFATENRGFDGITAVYASPDFLCRMAGSVSQDVTCTPRRNYTCGCQLSSANANANITFSFLNADKQELQSIVSGNLTVIKNLRGQETGEKEQENGGNGSILPLGLLLLFLVGIGSIWFVKQSSISPNNPQESHTGSEAGMQDGVTGADGWDEFLERLDEYEFEGLVARLWEAQGWEAQTTAESNDRGIDVVARREIPVSQIMLIQAKKYKEGNKVGSPEIQQYASVKHQYKEADQIVVVTTSSFTKQARETADDLNVKLVDGDNLKELLQEHLGDPETQP